ncbi:MAG: HAD-IIB family hydrolase [Phycisphaeraceae bacterium]|nr:HAD-IIB family hydrolase [Phycisphaeraceae bacterium]
MRYRLIAIDLDGTLLCPDGKVSEENRASLHKAHEAGAIVIPCTGRGWREARDVVTSIPDTEVGVFNTGAMVVGLRDGKTHHRAAFDSDLARELIALMADYDEAVLLYTDPAETGYEYVVTGRGEPTKNTRWWFEHNALRWAIQDELAPPLLDHVVRVGSIALAGRARQVVGSIHDAFGQRVEAFSFEALQDPGAVEPSHIVECFAAGVTKWRGIEWVAKQHGIEASEIAVIGDQINDVPMFEKAGCAVAMGNAIPVIKDAAHYHTLKNDEHGVAHAIEKMLGGDW